MTERPDRRSAARVVVARHLSGRVLEDGEVRILDLSTAGVGIEHAGPLQPGGSCTLEFSLPFGALRLTARVVWSLLRGDEQAEERDRGAQYQSGLALTELTSEQRTALARALETLQTTHRAPNREGPHCASALTGREASDTV